MPTPVVVDISNLFTTSYPPLTVVSDNDMVVVDNEADTITITPSIAGKQLVTLTAIDNIGQEAVSTFILDTTGEFIPVAADTARDTHYVNIDDVMVRTLLLEPEATNLCIYSDPNNWTPFSNAAVENLGKGVARISREVGTNQGISINQVRTDGTTYTFSYEAKWVSGSDHIGGHTNPFTVEEKYLDGVALGTGTSISNFPKDGLWHTVEFVVTATTTGTSPIYIQPGRNDSVMDAVYDIRNIQIEQGRRRTSFIPTYGAAATREADSLSFPIDFDPYDTALYFDGFVTGDNAVVMWGGPTGDSYAEIVAQATLERVLIRGRNSTGNGGAAVLTSNDPDIIGKRLEVIIRLSGGEMTVDGWLDGVQTLSGSTPSYPPDATWGDSLINVSRMTVVGISASSNPLASREVLAAGGDLFSYRPGDDLNEAIFTRASAAAQNNILPELPEAPEGWVFAFPHEAYAGGRVPVRDHTGAIVGLLTQGGDDDIDSTDPTLTREGWSLDGGDSLKIDFVGDLDVVRSLTDLIVALTTADSVFTIAHDNTGINAYVGYASQSNGASNQNIAGTPTTKVNGETYTPVNAGGLHSAVSNNTPYIVSIEGADLSTWNFVGYGGRSGTQLTGTIHAIALYLSDTEATEEAREQAYNYIQSTLSYYSKVYTSPPETEEIENQYFG